MSGTRACAVYDYCFILSECDVIIIILYAPNVRMGRYYDCKSGRRTTISGHDTTLLYSTRRYRLRPIIVIYLLLHKYYIPCSML